MTTLAEKQHMERVQALGCIVCRKLGLGQTPAEIHHVLQNGLRENHFKVLPLCPLHHRSGVNNEQHVSRHPWRKAFELRYGTENELLELVGKLLDNSVLCAVTV